MDIKDGDKKFKKAKQYITTSIFNWSKDYASAASTFDEAYKIYKKCEAWQKAINTQKQLLVCNQKMVDSWAMAKNYEEMVDIYIGKFPVDFETLRKTVTDCFVQYRMADSLDKGLQMVSKVTKYLKSKGQNKQGVQILKEAYRISLEDQKSFKKKQVFGLIIQNFLEEGLYEEAIQMYKDAIKNKNGVDCDEECLIIVILCILMAEPKRAETEMYQCGNIANTFLSSNEAESAQNLIKYYRQGKQQAFKKQTTRAAITTLFPLVIIKKLRAVIVPSAQKLQTATASQKQQMINNILF